jgi:GntR family transcriptional repressor for pyruvate dehydrogenase complex
MFKAAEKTEKISQHIIAQIRDVILSGKVKPGDRLASEKELLNQFNVSKATMREALRVLESMGLIEIKKGQNGGVFIAEVDMNTTLSSIINFLHFKSISIKDITMIRYILEPPVAEFAASRITLDDIHNLETMIEENLSEKVTDTSLGIGFHRYLARLSENPILILIMDFIDNMLRDIKLQLNLGPDFFNKVKEAHRLILDCLIEKDGVGAKREITKDILDVGKYMAELAGTSVFDPSMLEDPYHKYHGTSKESDAARISGHPISMKELEELIGKDMARKLFEKSIVFEQIGSGKLYLLDLKDQYKSNEIKNRYK